MGLWGNESHRGVTVVCVGYLLVMPASMITLMYRRAKRYSDTPRHRRSLGVAILIALMSMVGMVITLGTLWLLLVAWGFSGLSEF